jgi:hypothetical protein
MFKLSNNKVNSAGGVASARSQSNEVKTAMQVFKDQTSSAAKLQQYVDTTGPLKWVEGMSATVVRNIAKFGTQEQFNTLYADNLDAATSSELRLCIRRAYGKEDMDNTPVLEDIKTTKAPSQKRARSSEIYYLGRGFRLSENYMKMEKIQSLLVNYKKFYLK